MGFIFSKPVNYVKTKVTNTKQAITTKVTDTKTAIATRVSNTKAAVVHKVDDTKSGITNRVTSISNYIKSKVNAVVTSIKNVFQAVHNKYSSVKNNIKGRYQRTRDRVHGTYRKVRDTKLTRWQKVKYGFLAFVSLISFIIVTSVLVDLYHGDKEAAQAKIDTVYALFSFLASYLKYFGENLYSAGRIGGKFLWKAASIGGSHLWEVSKVIGSYTWEGTKVTGEYAWAVTSTLGLALANGALVAGENAAHYSKIGAQNAVQYSKVAAEYGWHGVTVGSVKCYEGSKVFLYNAGIWCREGAAYMWETSQTVAVGLATGSVSLTQVLMDVSVFLADKAYWTSLTVIEYSQWIAVGLWNISCSTGSFLVRWTILTAEGLYGGSVWTGYFTWDCLSSFSIWLYRFSISLADVIATKTIASMRFIWAWTYYITTEGSKALYVGFNKIGIRGAIALSKKLGEWSLVLGEIMWKFINDLVVYTGNFLYVLSVHIYNILYIVIAFLLQILMAVMSIIRLIINFLVAIVTFVFGGIIWVLEEAAGAYMFALHKYNMYREFLFIGFLGLLVLYCIGVMRDRRMSIEEEELESSDEDERLGLPDEIDADEELTGIKKQPRKVVRQASGRAKDLPPIYEERQKLPAYHQLSSSSDELDLGSDQDIPDALNSSRDTDEMLSGEEDARIEDVSTSRRHPRATHPGRISGQHPRSPLAAAAPESLSPSAQRPTSPTAPGQATQPRPTSPATSASQRPTSPSIVSSPRATSPTITSSHRPSSTATPRPTSPINATLPRPISPTSATALRPTSPTAQGQPNPTAPKLASSDQSSVPAALPKPVSTPSGVQSPAPSGKQTPALSTSPESTSVSVPQKPSESKTPVTEVELKSPSLSDSKTKTLLEGKSPEPVVSTKPEPESKPVKTEPPVTQAKPSATKTGFARPGLVKEPGELSQPGEQGKTEPKTPPAVLGKPKSALHERLSKSDASKLETPSKKSPGSPAKEEPSSPTKSLPLSSSPTEQSKQVASKPSTSPGFQSSTDVNKSVEAVPKTDSKTEPIAVPSKTVSPHKSIPASPSKISTSPSVSPTGTSPPGESPASPSRRGNSIRMLQQRLNQGSETSKPSGVKVRLADPSSSSPGKS